MPIRCRWARACSKLASHAEQSVALAGMDKQAHNSMRPLSTALTPEQLASDHHQNVTDDVAKGTPRQGGRMPCSG